MELTAPPPVSGEELDRIVTFLEAADGLKRVERAARVGERRENAAEHSWHVALAALVLGPELAEPVDEAHVLRLCLVHDLAEVLAGDTRAFGPDEPTRPLREGPAAERLFSLLPPHSAAALRALWEEFERGETREARVAVALDRLLGVLQIVHDDGIPWREHGVTEEASRARNLPLARVDPVLEAVLERVYGSAR